MVTAPHAVEKGTGCESRAIPLPCVLYNIPTAFISTAVRERPVGRIAGVGTSRKTCQVLNAAKNLARTRWQSSDNRCTRTNNGVHCIQTLRLRWRVRKSGLPIHSPSHHFSKADFFMDCLASHD